jgi:uncharacterized protein YcbX
VSDYTCTLASVHAYPIKSCGGVDLKQGLLIETGLELDRAWMVVNARGQMLTQREHPRMALVQCSFKGNNVVLRAPGMLALHLSLDRVEAPTHAQVWDDLVPVYDMGMLAAQWFTDFLQPGRHTPGQGLRLVRFNPEHQRLCDPAWTGTLPAQTAFADGYPLLVANTASLQDLNQRLVAAGAPAVDMRRFRPNLVLDGLPAFDEDHTKTLLIDTADGEVELRLVKPCTRCTMPDIDPDTALSAPLVGDTLAAYRADPRVDGAVTFGMNAVVVRGIEYLLQPGQTVRGRIAFD